MTDDDTAGSARTVFAELLKALGPAPAAREIRCTAAFRALLRPEEMLGSRPPSWIPWGIPLVVDENLPDGVMWELRQGGEPAVRCQQIPGFGTFVVATGGLNG